MAYCDALDSDDEGGIAVIPCDLFGSIFVSVVISVCDRSAEKTDFLPLSTVTIGEHDNGENIPPFMDAVRDRPVIDLTDSGVRRSAAIFFSKTSCIRANKGPNCRDEDADKGIVGDVLLWLPPAESMIGSFSLTAVVGCVGDEKKLNNSIFRMRDDEIGEERYSQRRNGWEL